MQAEIVLEEMKKFLRAHALGTEYIDSKEFALNLLIELEIKAPRARALRDSSRVEAIPPAEPAQ